MKLVDAILLSLAVGTLIIGIHQIMTAGFGQAYWIIMLFITLFFVYSYRKRKQD